MRFDFKNLGGIDSGSVTPGDLTIICGPNNVGKTYVSYSIYGLLRDIERLIEVPISEEQLIKLHDNGSLTIDLKEPKEIIEQLLKDASSRFSEKLHQFFNVSEDFFENSRTELNLESAEQKLNDWGENHYFDNSNYIDFDVSVEQCLIHATLHVEHEKKIPFSSLRFAISNFIRFMLLNVTIPTPFIATSERTGIALFYKELDAYKSNVIRDLEFSNSANPIDFMRHQLSRYASPIQNNIDVVRDYDLLSKQKSFIKNSPDKYGYVTDALRELMGGRYETIDNQVMYLQDPKPGHEKVTVPVYVASSSIKSLFLIDLYINSIARKNGMLIIDEPELNLHPDNQRKMAGLLARLVNAGVKVLITTHSDYIIREINNRIMLNSEFDDKSEIMNSANLNEHDVLKPEQVKAYSIKGDGKINDVEVDKYGINMGIFDDLIADANDLADKIYYSIED